MRDDSIGKNWFVNLDPDLKRAWLEGRTLDPDEQTSTPANNQQHDFCTRLKIYGRQKSRRND